MGKKPLDLSANGGYSYWTLDDSADMGYVEYEYIAVLAD